MTLAELAQAAYQDELDLAGVPLAPRLRQAFSASPDWDALSDNTVHAARLIQLKVLRLLPTVPFPHPEPGPSITRSPARLNPAQLEQATSALQKLLSPPLYSPPVPPDPDPAEPTHLNLLDVVRLARQALAAARLHQNLELEAATDRIEDMITLLEEALEQSGPAALYLDTLLEAQPDPIQRISLFLAVLELAKIAKLRIEQANTFSGITLYRYTE